jgi:hypothetical protein
MEFSTVDYISLISNIAEITALILVLATIYLISKEIKETRRIYTANAHSQIGISAAAFTESIYRDEKLLSVWLRGLTDSKHLNELETARFYMLLLSYWTLLANGYYLSKVDPTIVSRIEGMLDIMVIRKSVRDWWEEENYNPSPEFKSYVDTRIQQLKDNGLIPAEPKAEQIEGDSVSTSSNATEAVNSGT